MNTTCKYEVCGATISGCNCQCTVDKMKQENKELLKLIHDDLLMRGEHENGRTTVNLSSFIWKRIKDAIE